MEYLRSSLNADDWIRHAEMWNVCKMFTSSSSLVKMRTLYKSNWKQKTEKNARFYLFKVLCALSRASASHIKRQKSRMLSSTIKQTIKYTLWKFIGQCIIVWNESWFATAWEAVLVRARRAPKAGACFVWCEWTRNYFYRVAPLRKSINQVEIVFHCNRRQFFECVKDSFFAGLILLLFFSLSML